jgi:coenzyme F420-reducing hydrogenase gamma subunit
MVARKTPCLGPVTQAGCDALCPTYNRGCYACFGPKETPNTRSLSDRLHNEIGLQEKEIMRMFRSFNANAEPFRQESKAHEKQ